MKSMMTAAFAIVIGLAGSGIAAGNAFEDVDTNADGAISKAEAATVEGLDFDKADTNKDGQLSRVEYAAATTTDGNM